MASSLAAEGDGDMPMHIGRSTDMRCPVATGGPAPSSHRILKSSRLSLSRSRFFRLPLHHRFPLAVPSVLALATLPAPDASDTADSAVSQPLDRAPSPCPPLMSCPHVRCATAPVSPPPER